MMGDQISLSAVGCDGAGMEQRPRSPPETKAEQ